MEKTQLQSSAEGDPRADGTVLGGWEFLRGGDLSALLEITRDWALPPSLGLSVLASTDDTVMAAVLFGDVSFEPDALLYLENRGVYEILRCERWPSGRVQLTLGSCQSR
jgi:hypothetical protein